MTGVQTCALPICTLRRITIKDAAQAEKMFELLMGNEVAPRKDFIATAEIDRERIDA